MSIVCGITSLDPGGESDPAIEAAVALAHRTSRAPVPIVGDPETWIRSAAEEDAELLVVAAPRGSTVVDRLAHDAAAPLLVVRDPAPFVRWAAGRAPLRAVFGWDDTATTAAALDPLIALRRSGPVDVEIVHVYYPDEAARRYGARVASVVDPAPELEALLRRDIEHQVGELPGDGAVTITLVRGLGHVGEHLLAHAEAAGADLVVVGNHHRGGLRRLPSVAARVVADAAASVLLVPLRPGAALDHAPVLRAAVVATDGSAFANRAIPYAYRLVPEDGEVHLVRVVAPDDHDDDRALIDALLRLRPSSCGATRTIAHVVRDRDPAHAIAVAAERVGADVVCIASHGRGGLTRALVGSVTDRLLHVCRRPVLVVHPTE